MKAKNILILFFIFLASACHSQTMEKDYYLNKVKDSIIVVANVEKSRADSLKKLSDSLYFKLLVANDKIARIKRYVKICDKNPSQKKFFFGWISRAVK